MLKLKKYVGLDYLDRPTLGEPHEYPGPIDNSYILKSRRSSKGEIKAHLNDDLDYVMVPEEVWALLADHFTLVPGQRPIARQVRKSVNVRWFPPGQPAPVAQPVRCTINTLQSLFGYDAAIVIKV